MNKKKEETDMDHGVSIERRLVAMETFYRAHRRTTCFISPIFPEITDIEIYDNRNNSYWEWLDKKIKTYASEMGLGYVTNDDSVRRPFGSPPVIVNYFYHA